MSKTVEFTSEPDGNTIKVCMFVPESGGPHPCVYYIHGGGMQSMSCFLGNYQAWGKIIAAQGVAVAMVDFRNALTPSSAPEIAPFPAGLNDCVSGLHWLAKEGAGHGIDSSEIIIAGESGGGNLTLATGLKAESRRRHRPHPGPLRAVPLHRRKLASRRPAVIVREQRHPARPAQQPRRPRLRHRGPE